MSAILQALRQRDSAELVLQGADAELTAGDVIFRVSSLVLQLRETGATTIALCGENSPYWALLDLACQEAQICLVPIPTFFTEHQISHLLDTAAVELVIFEEKIRTRFLSLSSAIPQILHDIEGYSSLQLDSAAQVLMPHGTHKITFTSGSTGEPKGVCLATEQCIKVAYSLARASGVEQPVHLSLLPLSTLLENIGGIYMPLLSGGRSVLLSAQELGLFGSSGLSAGPLLDALQCYQPQTLILVPQLLTVLDAAMADGWQAPESLRFVAVGGARVAPALVQRVRARGLPVYEGYGLSECASVVSLNAPGSDRIGTSGKILPHLRVQVKNGELQVSGNAFLGYLNQPDSWGTSVVPTGDLGNVDAEGYVTVSGRKKNTIISSFGRNISPEWVESELLASRLVQQVAVLGEGRPFCSALILATSPSVTESQLQAEINQVNARLPDYAQIGKWIRLQHPLSADSGLLTENGRLRRAAIAQYFEQDIERLYSNYQEAIAL